MRSVTVVALAALFATLAACASDTDLIARASSGHALIANCPEAEGYPDCQAGHRIEIADNKPIQQASR